jgi:hypothetical protein
MCAGFNLYCHVTQPILTAASMEEGFKKGQVKYDKEVKKK